MTRYRVDVRRNGGGDDPGGITGLIMLVLFILFLGWMCA